MWAIAAPALAASIAASAIWRGVTGTLSERLAVSPDAGDGAGDEHVAAGLQAHAFLLVGGLSIAPGRADHLPACAAMLHTLRK